MRVGGADTIAVEESAETTLLEVVNTPAGNRGAMAAGFVFAFGRFGAKARAADQAECSIHLEEIHDPIG